MTPRLGMRSPRAGSPGTGSTRSVLEGAALRCSDDEVLHDDLVEVGEGLRLRHRRHVVHREPEAEVLQVLQREPEVVEPEPEIIELTQLVSTGNTCVQQSRFRRAFQRLPEEGSWGPNGPLTPSNYFHFCLRRSVLSVVPVTFVKIGSLPSHKSPWQPPSLPSGSALPSP